MQALAFTLDPEALARWAPDYIDPPESWDPREFGSEGDVLQLVDNAPHRGVITWPFPDVLKASIGYSYSEDGDGGGYIWTLDLERDDVPSIRLASHWRDQRRIVRDGTVGRKAMRSILEEAVRVANELLRDYTAWLGLTAPLKLVIITHRHGENFYLSTDEATARKLVHDYVSERWYYDGLEVPMPADRDEAIDAYFAHALDEDYSIDDVTLGGPHPTTQPRTRPTVDPRGIVITRDQLTSIIGRKLTDDEVATLDECWPNSSIPEALQTIAEHALPAPRVYIDRLSDGLTVQGPFDNEVEASEFMDTQGRSDETHKLVWGVAPASDKED